MSTNSAIEWTDHTFNPWWGCSKVSSGCANCYAEGVAERFAPGNLWGRDAERKVASDKVWNDPIRWNRAAEKAGKPARVFCLSMGDVFEDRADLDIARAHLFDLIERTPWLWWLLLTKRPENLRTMAPVVAMPNVALGVSVENQEAADRRIPLLLSAPAAIRFLSVEPMLGPVDIDRYLWAVGPSTAGPWTYPSGKVVRGGEIGGAAISSIRANELHWVILGGESGPKARPVHPDWARKVRDQCDSSSVPFFFKQWGEFVPNGQTTDDAFVELEKRGAEPFRCGPDASFDGQRYFRTGKHAAGSMLDGREWKQVPQALLVRP